MNLSASRQVWVIGFPKSGNTWLSYLLSYAYNLPFFNFGDPKGRPQKAWVDELTGGENAWAALTGFDSVQKTHKYPHDVPHQGGLVVYAIRDPRDVYVSYHHFMRSPNARIWGRLRYYILGLLGKPRQIEWFLEQWQRHLEIWLPHVDVMVSYDRLLAEGAPYLVKCFQGGPGEMDETLAASALDQFSFEKMSGGRKAGNEKQGSFFRKGISGDWKNFLSPGEAAGFEIALKKYQEVSA